MKRIAGIAFCILISVISFAQRSGTDKGVINLFKFDVSPQGLGLSGDLKLGYNTLLELATGVGSGYAIAENSVNYHLAILQPAFYFYANPKFFYDRHSRSRKNKTMDFNSGNYIGMRLKYTTADISSSGVIRDAFLYNIHWGMQRRIGLRWVLGGQIGGGYAMDIGSGFGSIYPAFDFKFAYIISPGKMR